MYVHKNNAARPFLHKRLILMLEAVDNPSHSQQVLSRAVKSLLADEKVNIGNYVRALSTQGKMVRQWESQPLELWVKEVQVLSSAVRSSP